MVLLIVHPHRWKSSAKNCYTQKITFTRFQPDKDSALLVFINCTSPQLVNAGTVLSHVMQAYPGLARVFVAARYYVGLWFETQCPAFICS